MSHDATNWAIKQRGLKPATKLVLWHLCDRYHPDHGCFPSQDTLASDCELSRSSLNDHLNALEEAGLIARERRRRKGTAQQESTFYRLAFEPGFAAVPAEKPCPEIGHGQAPEAVSENATEPCPKNAESRVRNSDSNPVREPVIEPVTEREGASASEGEEDPRRMTQRVKALELGRHGNPWPGALGSSTDWAIKQFAKLSAEERRQAEERRDDYLALVERHKLKPVALGVYLRDRKFLDVPAQQAKAAREAKIHYPVFGPVWAALRALALLDGPERVDLPDDLRALVAKTYEVHKRASEPRAAAYLAARHITLAADGRLIFPDGFEQQEYRRKELALGFPEVNRLHELAKKREHGVAEGRAAGLAELCEAVPVDGPIFEAWMRYHERRNWPFVPDWGAMRVVYFPKGGPEGLEEFRRAAAEIMADAKERMGHVHAAAE